MLLAELNIRHTRRHMATRRVAIEPSYLPTSGPGHGTALLGAVVAENMSALDADDIECFDRSLYSAREGINVPAIVLRHRLQTDTHGLDRSRHRLLGEDGWLVAELDVHGAARPQMLGAMLAVASLPSVARAAAVRSLREVLRGNRNTSDDVVIRRLTHGHPAFRPPPAGVRFERGAPPDERAWSGVSSDRRWAMEVLDLTAGVDLLPAEVTRRYRALLRLAHPDHGGSDDYAAERIAELAEAREILLMTAASSEPDASVESGSAR